jgi:hypothetical protein
MRSEVKKLKKGKSKTPINVVKFVRAYKTEINPTAKQKQKIHQTIGVCRFIYNFYLAHNKEVYEKEKRSRCKGLFP